MSTASINVISRGTEAFLLGASSRCTKLHAVSSLAELGSLLARLLDQPSGVPSRLDLIGHSTRSAHLLKLGETAIDMFDPMVERFFQTLAGNRSLTRLNVVALRLLGCETAVEPGGQRTMARLARVVGVPVFGTRKPLQKSHYNEAGFDPTFKNLLVESSRLPNPPARLE